jgi:SRSO17 transposase
MGGITPAELAAIRGRLEGFAADLFASLPRRDQRARGQCYLRGLLLDGRRKSIEPMAARLGKVHFSRYVVGWMVAHREAATLAERLLTEAITAQGVQPGTLTVHADAAPR